MLKIFLNNKVWMFDTSKRNSHVITAGALWLPRLASLFPASSHSPFFLICCYRAKDVVEFILAHPVSELPFNKSGCRWSNFFKGAVLQAWFFWKKVFNKPFVLWISMNFLISLQSFTFCWIVTVAPILPISGVRGKGIGWEASVLEGWPNGSLSSSSIVLFSSKGACPFMFSLKPSSLDASFLWKWSILPFRWLVERRDE